MVVVVDNGMYGTIRMHQERDYPRPRLGDRSRTIPISRRSRAPTAAMASASSAPRSSRRRSSARWPSGKPAILHCLLDPQAITPTRNARRYCAARPKCSRRTKDERRETPGRQGRDRHRGRQRHRPRDRGDDGRARRQSRDQRHRRIADRRRRVGEPGGGNAGDHRGRGRRGGDQHRQRRRSALGRENRAMRARSLRQARRGGQQRRHPARHDLPQDDRRRLDLGDQRPPQRLVLRGERGRAGISPSRNQAASCS